MQRKCRVHIVHKDIFSPEGIFLQLGQTIRFQQKGISGVYIRNELTDFFPGKVVLLLLYTGKTQGDHGITSLQTPVFLLLPHGQSLK